NATAESEDIELTWLHRDVCLISLHYATDYNESLGHRVNSRATYAVSTGSDFTVITQLRASMQICYSREQNRFSRIFRISVDRNPATVISNQLVLFSVNDLHQVSIAVKQLILCVIDYFL